MWRHLLTIFGYVLLTVLVIALTAALVYNGKGYTYDFKTNRIVQKGLVLIGSVPSGLQVTLNEANVKGKKTPYRAAYEAGHYQFGLSKTGFWSWSKSLQVIAGEVTLAQYVILVPKHPSNVVLDTRPQIVAQNISRDHRHLAYITGGPESAVYTLDLTNPKPVKLYTPAGATGATPAEVLRDVVWSDDASHLLIASTIGADPIRYLASASGGDPVNLTTQYRFDFTGLKFSGNNWRQLYWVSPDGLRRLDVEAQSVSGVLADKVSQILTTPDRVLYVQQTDLGRSLWSVDNTGHHDQLIPALVESDTYSLAFANYNGQNDLAVVPAKTKTATLYTDIYSSTPEAKTIAHNVTTADFSPSGHYLAFSSPDGLQTYDVERSLIDHSLVLYHDTAHPGEGSVQTWFDDSHLLTNRASRLFWSDYDGTNAVDLGPVVGAFPGYGSYDGRSVVAFRMEGESTHVMGTVIRP